MHEDVQVLGEPRRVPPRPLCLRLKRHAKFSIVGGTVFLLMSQGGAIYAAPALILALWWAARSSRIWGRLVITFLAALVVTEVGWFIAYAMVGEQQPWIAFGPALGFTATVASFVLTLGPKPRERTG